MQLLRINIYIYTVHIISGVVVFDLEPTVNFYIVCAKVDCLQPAKQTNEHLAATATVQLQVIKKVPEPFG